MGVTYNLWDASLIFGCVCNTLLIGPFSYFQQYIGYFCKDIQCPRGDNPKTLHGRHEQQKVFCAADGGTFTLTFRDKTIGPIAYNANAATVETAFEAGLA